MASRNAEYVVQLMRNARVTDNEAKAFMGQALVVVERDNPGGGVRFLKELIASRAGRPYPDMSAMMR